MNRNDKDGASGTDGLRRIKTARQRKDRSAVELKKNITPKKNPLHSGRATLVNREKLATAREDNANLREQRANLRDAVADQRDTAARAKKGKAQARDAAATSRELRLRTAETAQTANDDQMTMLQQANAHLVIATLEAQKLAEQVHSAKVELDHLAHHDMLTDLPNRILLQDRLTQAVELARRQERQLAVMFMDLDQFKHINDSLGHAVGDQLLQSVAKRLVSCVRHSDTISRQGGDEFVLLLPYIERAEDAALSAQKMLTALEPSHHIDQHDLHIGVSIGISIYPEDGNDAETLIRCADTAMYHAKENGRNNYKFFEQNMNARAVQRQSVEADLRYALARKEFALHYQPKINLHDGKIFGAEALIRWHHPVRGLLLPIQFVPIAEDCNLILPIGRWVLREACRQARAWQLAGLPPIVMAVNTSALEFHAQDFFENIRVTLQDACLEPRYLELELTESILMRDAESTDTLLRALADLGVKLAIDDFGTGYSSLSYLSKYPIHTLKIDQSFVSHMTSNDVDASIVSAVISLGKSLKQSVIAEGVETSEQHAFLLAQHCEVGQGYYFSRPLPTKEFTDLLADGRASTPVHFG